MDPTRNLRQRVPGSREEDRPGLQSPGTAARPGDGHRAPAPRRMPGRRARTMRADDGNDRIAPPELSAFVGSVWSARLPRYQSNPRTRANRIAAPSINAPTRADRVIPGQIAEHERDEADQHHRRVGLCASRDQHFASRSQQGQFPYLHPFRRLSPAEEENDAEKKTRPEH